MMRIPSDKIADNTGLEELREIKPASPGPNERDATVDAGREVTGLQLPAGNNESPRSGSRRAIDELAVNTVRTLAMDAVQAANSGHAGTPMGLAPLGYVLFTKHLAHDPKDPSWADRDRFVLSAGHASMLQYSLLHLTGYDLSLDDLKKFRQLGSKTPGHPERGVTPGVEMSTGPLGQGIATSVGVALAERLLAARFNKPGHEIIDHRTFVIAGDGDIMEGVSAEAASLAGQLGLGRLVVFYDDNKVTIDGSTEISLSKEDVGKRYEAYGWRVLAVKDPNDLDELDRVMAEAKNGDGRPTLVRVPTTIGFGAPTKAGKSVAHGAPLGEEEVAGAKKNLGWSYPEPFTVPPAAKKHADQTGRGRKLHKDWSERFEAYAKAYPELAAELKRVLSGELPADWAAALPKWEAGAKESTRKASGAVLNAIAKNMPELIGGSADLSTSTNSNIKDGGSIKAGDYSGRNVNYGVREHAMAAALNGLAVHGGIRPFGSTFFSFADYLKPALRMSALMGTPAIYLMTHDSIGVGEDGATHQPIEQLAMLRATPNVSVIRPADANETAGAWKEAIERQDGPTVLVLSRQDLPVLAGTDPAQVARGAYVVQSKGGDPAVLIVATGAEVSLAVKAAAELEARGVNARVVSMPSWDRFEKQDRAYQAAVFPPGVPVLAVEAGSSLGWSKYSNAQVALDHFGESAPAPELYEKFGFSPENVAQRALALIAAKK